MLRQCTNKSLLLIDEFGKGTNPLDGMALLASMIEHLVSHQKPRMLVTTHFLELFEYGLLSQETMDRAIDTYRMQTHIPRKTSADDDLDDLDDLSQSHEPPAKRKSQIQEPEEDEEEDAVPLFILKPGVASSSDGLGCARYGGLPEELLQRAQVIMEQLDKGLPITPLEAMQGTGSSACKSLVRGFLDEVSWQGASTESFNAFKARLLAYGVEPQDPGPIPSTDKA